jgi:hypothetical protein
MNEDGAVMFSSFGQTTKHGNKSIAPVSHREFGALQEGLDDVQFDGGESQPNWDDDGDDGDCGDFGPLGDGQESVTGPMQTPLKSLPISISRSHLKPTTRLQPPSWGPLLPQLFNPSTTSPPAVMEPPPPSVNPLALHDPHDPTESNRSKPVQKDKRTFRIPLTKQNQLKVNTSTSGLTRRQVMLNSISHHTVDASQSSSASSSLLSSRQKTHHPASQLMSSIDLISMITRCSINSTSPSSLNQPTKGSLSHHRPLNHMSLSGHVTPISSSLALFHQQKRSASHGVTNPLLVLGLREGPLGSSSHEAPRQGQQRSHEGNDDDEGGVAGGYYDGGFDDGAGGDDDDDGDYGGHIDGFHYGDDGGEGGEVMNDALHHLNEERVLAQRVENALNDAGLNLLMPNSGSASDTRPSLGFNCSIISSNSQHHLNDTPHHTSQDSFEQLCKKYIQNFIIGSEKYNRETQLSRRVSEWTKKMEPLLREQEERVEFDIHKYSDETLEAIHLNSGRNRMMTKQHLPIPTSQPQSTPVHFSELVSGKSSHEVSRVFLACLQLANLGNIDFAPTDHLPNLSTMTSGGGEVFDFDVNLLNEKSNRLQIESYRAPSLLTD